MGKVSAEDMEQALRWCASILGPSEVRSDHTKTHGDRVSSTCRIATPKGICYLKVHQDRSEWEREVHAYEHWTPAFGDFAPRLLAVSDGALSALVISELAGTVVENAQLTPLQQRGIWRAAGAALRPFHDQGTGTFFGPSSRAGTALEANPHGAVELLTKRFSGHLDRAVKGGYFKAGEQAIVQTACKLIPAFEGERPVPCHMDYCPANWLASAEGVWAGVIDFEFSQWNVRVADLTRDPDWSWIRRPDLVEAFYEGYGRTFTPLEKKQLLVAHTEYALAAILWGRDNEYFGYEREGHEALMHLSSLLG